MSEQHINNPYWEAVQQSGALRRGQVLSAHDADRLMRDIHFHDDLCTRYAWAIPDPASVRFVAHWLSPRAVEMGAGTGYWAWLLRQSGVDLVAYDETPASCGGYNHWHTQRNWETGQFIYAPMPSYSEVFAGSPRTLLAHADRALFLCWPPCDDPMAAASLRNYFGQRLVYIGVGDGGCTGDDAFHQALADEWTLVDEHQLPQWPTIHDRVWVYKRGTENEATA